MELPQLGDHCDNPSCNKLDFLPMKCDACRKIFCSDHLPYDTHQCTESYKKDNQVPVCPLCNIPIPLRPGQSADAEVGKHIDSDCQSDPAKERRGKVFTNRCSKKGCKTKELVPINCGKCRQNFCIKHRMEADHACQGFQTTGRGISNGGAAAMSRASTSTSQPQKTRSEAPKKVQQTLTNMMGSQLARERQGRNAQSSRVAATTVHGMQGTMSEDEALAHAMAMSMNPQANQQPPNTTGAPDKHQQESEDEALARALQLSEEEARRGRQSSNTSSSSQGGKDKSCSVS